jgi:LacI family transcriptional regulator
LGKAQSRKAISIRAVAAAAQVSVTTVSHVVSGKRPVSPETAKRVRRAMRRLGYVPNHVARSLVLGRTRTIGLLVPDIANPFFANLARGVEDRAEALGFSVVLCNTDFNADREARYMDVLRARGLDGIIYAAGAPPSFSRLVEVAKSFPLVVVDEQILGIQAPSIVSNNRAGGYLVGQHLAALGHRTALYVGGPPILLTTKERLAGFEEGFLGDGASIHRVYADYRRESSYAAVKAFLRTKTDFTAIFAGNDLMAIGAIQALREAGRLVPGDISVVGFDDTLLAELHNPPLSTVHQPVYDLGRHAAETMIRSLEPPRHPVPSTLVLDVSFIDRGSTSAVAGRATPTSSRVRVHQ